MEIRGKPRLRGWSHAAGVPLAVAGTAILVVLTTAQPAKAATMALYGLSLVLLLGVSAIYHVGTWQSPVRGILRAFDHANIFVFIAATYTAIVFNVLTGYWRAGLLTAIWLLAIAGIATMTPVFKLPRWASAGLYVGIGWIGLVAVPQISGAVGIGAILLILLGGLFYSAGAAAYAIKRPRLLPSTFGYHEVFHALVLGASASFFLVLAIYIAPVRRST